MIQPTHLLIIGYSPQPLTEFEVWNSLILIADKIRMTRSGDPILKWFANGWSGWQWIEESHIAIDTILKWVGICIFSCKWFEPFTTGETISQLLKLEQVSYHVLPDRGTIKECDE